MECQSSGECAQQLYDALRLCVSALQLALPVAERLEFLNDAVDACEGIASLCERMRISSRSGIHDG
jgi:hypothetical protein